MAYRKFQSNSFFNGEHFVAGENVLITDEGGAIVEIVEASGAGDDVQKFQGVISPGFVNAHCHLELSHMKGRVPQGTGLVNFLTTVIRQRGVAPEEIQEAMQLADARMFEAGISAVGDICNTPLSIGVKKKSKISWRNFIEVLGFTETNAAKRLEDGQKTLNAFLEAGMPVGNSSLTPHAPYSVSAGLFELINSQSAGQRCSIHNQESWAEQDLFADGNGAMFKLYENLNIDPSFFISPGTSSVLSYLPMLDQASGIILVHNTFSTEDDIDFVMSRQGINEIFFCLCPQANKYIESTKPPVSLIRSKGGSIILGTDSLASNYTLSVLEEIKLLHLEFSDIPVSEILSWATLNGAKALEMENKFGSFETGKNPGVILLDGINEHEIKADAKVTRLL